MGWPNAQQVIANKKELNGMFEDILSLICFAQADLCYWSFACILRFLVLCFYDVPLYESLYLYVCFLCLYYGSFYSVFTYSDLCVFVLSSFILLLS